MQKIVFLDRDGTLNEEVEYLYRPEELRILPGVGEALRSLREAGFLLVLITNQAGIGRGFYSERDCEMLNAFLNEELKKQGAALDAAYYCPHHPTHGIGGYRKSCACRKPETGLFLQAEKDLLEGKMNGGQRLHQSGLCLSEEEMEALRTENREEPEKRDWLSGCYMIGDKRLDAQAGKRFGIRGLLLGSGYGKEEREKAEPCDYDEYFNSMKEAAEWIVKREQGNSWRI